MAWRHCATPDTPSVQYYLSHFSLAHPLRKQWLASWFYHITPINEGVHVSIPRINIGTSWNWPRVKMEIKCPFLICQKWQVKMEIKNRNKWQLILNGGSNWEHENIVCIVHEFENKLSDINNMIHSIDNGYLHWEGKVARYILCFILYGGAWMGTEFKKEKNFWLISKEPLRLVVVNIPWHFYGYKCMS